MSQVFTAIVIVTLEGSPSPAQQAQQWETCSRERPQPQRTWLLSLHHGHQAAAQELRAMLWTQAS